MKRILMIIALPFVITGCGNFDLCHNYCYWYMEWQESIGELHSDPIYLYINCVQNACPECYEDDEATQVLFNSMEQEEKWTEDELCSK